MALRALVAMKLLQDQPKLVKEIAGSFLRPVLVRRRPYEIGPRGAA